MKAMVLHQPDEIRLSPLKVTDYGEPIIKKSNEILIKVKCCGVCHTDLHIVEGELSLIKTPIVPGHQVVGEVVGMGKDVQQFQKGERVGVTWLYSTCQECDYCRQGQENLCDRARFTGYHFFGGFAEFMVIPSEFAFKIPASFSDSQAAPFLCAGVIGYRSLKLSEIVHGGKLGFYGFGASAHIAIQIARHWDCEVYVFTRSEEHRQHALQLGAKWVGSAQDDPGTLMDASILFAPVGPLVPDMLKRLKKGGTVAINAVHMTAIPELSYDLIYYEKTIRSVSNLTRQDMQELWELAQEIPIKTDAEEFPLEQANQVLQSMKLSKIKGAAVLKVSSK